MQDVDPWSMKVFVGQCCAHCSAVPRRALFYASAGGVYAVVCMDVSAWPASSIVVRAHFFWWSEHICLVIFFDISIQCVSAFAQTGGRQIYMNILRAI